MTFLERAKAVQLKTATETHCWVRLDLLEGLIAEIEALRDEVERRRIVSPESVAEITKRMGGGVTAKRLGAGQ